MSVALMDRVDPAVALRSLHESVDDLLAADFAAGSDDELLDTFRQLEALRRRLAAVDHALILEAQARQLPATVAVRNTVAFLRALLRLDPREAAGRVRAAEAAGTRRALTGEVLPPAFPEVAAAQQAGEISSRHAAVITTTVAKLPDEVRQEEGDEIEASLVDYARRFDPDSLGKLGRRVLYCYDPDGPEPDEEYRQRLRDITVTKRPDGSIHGTFEGTSELGELLLTHFDALAAPRPEVGGVKDTRTAGQRRHDALLECLKLVLRAELLPKVAGVTATVVVTMTKEQYESGRGLARTAHGALVPAGEALRWGGGDLRLLAVVLSRIRGIEAYGSTARLFSENQRLAIQARDGGCTFPHCEAPPGWTQIHHMIDYAEGGPTTVDNGAMVCDYDHRERIRQGWKPRLISGRIGWIPPKWIDPAESRGLGNGCRSSCEEQLVQPVGWGLQAQGRAWTFVEGVGDAAQVGGGVNGQVAALLEPEAQQPVGVLVGATLPG